jgi:hypothetical protein
LKCSSKILTSIAGAAVVLALTACGSGGNTPQKATSPGSTPAVGDSAEVSPSAGISTEGPVTTADGRFIEYPDGFRIDFVSAKEFSSAEVEKALPGSYDVKTGNERDIADGNVAVKVTLKYTNGTSENLPVESSSMMNGFYGVNRVPADSVSWADDNIFHRDPMPTRIASGSSELFWNTFEVPKADLASFVVEPDLLGGDYTTYTFTEIDQVLK